MASPENDTEREKWLYLRLDNSWEIWPKKMIKFGAHLNDTVFISQMWVLT